MVGKLYTFFFFLGYFLGGAGNRNGSWLPCPVVLMGLDRFRAFENCFILPPRGKACTRPAEEVGEDEEVSGAVIFLNSAGYLAEAVEIGLCSGSSAEPFFHIGTTVLRFRGYVIASSYLNGQSR